MTNRKKKKKGMTLLFIYHFYSNKVIITQIKSLYVKYGAMDEKVLKFHVSGDDGHVPMKVTPGSVGYNLGRPML